MFTDVQGSTAAWERYHAAFGEALQHHDKILRSAISANNGYLVKTAGDAFMAAYARAEDAVACALAIQHGLARAEQAGEWSEVGTLRVRIGLHTGEPTFRDNDYYGPVANRAARIADAAHGGMILLSEATYTEVAATLPLSVIVKDHDCHRLKDLGQPERLYELRAAGFESLWCDEPLRTLESLQQNFPDQITSLVGRRKERDELNTLLAQPQSRLITLTGPGGTGKTRLAMQIAADRVQDFKDGVWLAELAAIQDPRAVPAAVAVALRIEIPASSDPLSALLNFLRPKRALLVLDNFEQVAEAAPMISSLLRECPNLKCLVTSRELLHLTGEREYPVEPLSIPPAGEADTDWSSYDSFQLFVERCQTARSDFTLTPAMESVVGEICRRLDGIPLAIELAAARVRGISPVQILQRLTRRFDLLASTLRDVPERQRTLRGAIDWSYELLTEDERGLFSELAVFNGGFFIDAAESICLTAGAFDLIFSLRDKSLLKTDEALGETRYFMLETIREYASQKLLTLPIMAQLRDRHADYYLRRAQDWCEKLARAGADAEEALNVFRADLENMRAGMDWSAQTDRPEMSIEYGKALFPYLRRQGLYEECETRAELAEDAARRLGDDRSAARLLNQRGLLAMERSQLSLSRDLLSRSLDISRELDDRPRELVSLINLGTVHWLLSEFSKASSQWQHALELSVETRQPRYEAFIRENLGILACQEGRLDEADQLYARSLEMHRLNANQEGLASALYNSSEVLRKRKQYAASLSRVEESNSMYVALDHHRGMALTQVRIGLILLESGDAAGARDHVLEGLRLARLIENRHAEMYGKNVLGRIEMAEGRNATARELFAQALALGKELSDRCHRAETLRRFATLLKLEGDALKAAQLYRFVKQEFDEMGVAGAAEIAEEIYTVADDLGPEEMARLTADSGLFDPESLIAGEMFAV